MATRLPLHIRKRGHDHGQQDTVRKPSGRIDPADRRGNAENAPAYALAPKQALAQYAATGCFGRTFYATAEEQLTRVLELCEAPSIGDTSSLRASPSTAGRNRS